MENFEFYLASPFFLIIVLIGFIIQHLDKFQLLLPNNQKRLEKLVYSKSLGAKDELLNDFMDDQILKLNFTNSTGLIMNKNNVKLLDHHKIAKNEIDWEEFLRIKKYLLNYKGSGKIMSSGIKRKIYLNICSWSFFFIFGISSFFIIYFKHNQIKLSITLIDNLFWPVFLFVISEIMFLNERDRYKTIQKYDSIIEAN
jgi:hypothetical protein